MLIKGKCTNCHKNKNNLQLPIVCASWHSVKILLLQSAALHVFIFHELWDFWWHNLESSPVVSHHIWGPFINIFLIFLWLQFVLVSQWQRTWEILLLTDLSSVVKVTPPPPLLGKKIVWIQRLDLKYITVWQSIHIYKSIQSLSKSAHSWSKRLFLKR